MKTMKIVSEYQQMKQLKPKSNDRYQERQFREKLLVLQEKKIKISSLIDVNRTNVDCHGNI